MEWSTYDVRGDGIMVGLKEITCDPACGFLVRSHEEKEVIDMTMAHTKHAHPEMKVTKDELKKMVKSTD